MAIKIKNKSTRVQVLSRCGNLARPSKGKHQYSLMQHRRSQVTIFIIIAILIVVAIVVAILFFGKIDIQKVQAQDAVAYIDECAKTAVEPSIAKMLENGGKNEPEIFLNYQGKKYNYLCYQKNFYLTCVNQAPMISAQIENEIKRDSEEKIIQCFESLEQELKNKGFLVSMGQLSYSIQLAPKTVKIIIERDVGISKGDNKQNFQTFNSRALSPLYDLAMIAREIVNQESQYCNFEYNGFMLLYPEYDIKRISYDDSKVYKLFDRKSGKEFKFAIRSCAFPPGL